ncbi:hypothetical protein [Amycolatopsis regifaucium]|uniref:Sulfatase n=1 Tax=Amycolatopsis regifaucium TaxID=546365 RepID=A0A154MMM0_9PSEU|nr:hypothetical protein [Amycolatopsis regifaucium]KZB85604.1 hypothetical protein AVL48_29515 [Amycolatopsis regifaucium]OKA10643.1 hypothetical protein ATP06_0204395 [Amycolatopsis regifaucium]SFI85145.1 hypothetical protein SAMN04489731_113250 [Amycolatopsis regifaucium]
MRLAGGLLIALAVGTSGAGYWVLVAAVVAALLAVAAEALLPPLGDTRPERVAGAVSRLGLVLVFATTFGHYLFPTAPGAAAAVFAVVVAVADLAGVRLGDHAARWVTGLLLAAAAALIAICVGIPPLARFIAPHPPSVPGLGLAVLVLLPFLLPRRPGAGRAAAVGAVAVAIVVVALYQLGPVRLGLSATSFRELLAAADGVSLLPVLTVVAAVATVPVAVDAFTDGRERLSPERPKATLACGLIVAAVSAFAGPVVALGLAGVGTLAELVLRVRARGYRAKRA